MADKLYEDLFNYFASPPMSIPHGNCKIANGNIIFRDSSGKDVLRLPIPKDWREIGTGENNVVAPPASDDGIFGFLPGYRQSTQMQRNQNAQLTSTLNHLEFAVSSQCAKLPGDFVVKSNEVRELNGVSVRLLTGQFGNDAKFFCAFAYTEGLQDTTRVAYCFDAIAFVAGNATFDKLLSDTMNALERIERLP